MPIYIYRDFQHCCQYIYIFSKSVRDDGDDDDHLVIHRRWWCRYFSAFLCVSQSQRFSICLCVFLRFFVILYILLDFSWFSSSSSSLLLKLCKLIFAAIANEDGLGWVRIVNRWHPQIAWPGSKLIGCLLPRWEGLVHTSLLPETVGRSAAKNAWKYSTPHTHPSSCLPPLVIPRLCFSVSICILLLPTSLWIVYFLEKGIIMKPWHGNRKYVYLSII